MGAIRYSILSIAAEAPDPFAFLLSLEVREEYLPFAVFPEIIASPVEESSSSMNVFIAVRPRESRAYALLIVFIFGMIEFIMQCGV